MKMRTLLLSAAAAIALAAPSLAEGVKVGLITTLSGGGAGIGADVRDGFMLALKQAGDAGAQVEVILEDDQQKPDIAVQIADKMIQSENVDVLTGIIWSNLAMAVVPAATAQGKVYLSTNAAPSALAGEGCNPNYFSVSYQNDNLHEAAGAYASEKGIKKMLIMAPNYPAGQDSLAGFKRFYNGEVVAEVYTQVGQTDFAGEIAQIRASGAEEVFFFQPGGMGIAFLKQYAEFGVDIPLIGPGFSLSEDILPAVGDAALGIKSTSHWSTDLDNPANKAFVEAFRAEHGRFPSLYAAQAYDTANLLVSALAKAGPDDQAAFLAAIKAADFASVRGKFSFGPNQHPIQDIYVLEVEKRDDALTNKIVGTAMTDRGDAYAELCKM